MACIAGVWYTGQASTVYEIDLCILVALLTCNATTVLSMLSRETEKTRERLTRTTVHVIGLLIGLGNIYNSLSRISSDSTLEDFHCYGKNNLPHRFLLVSVRLQLIAWGLFLAEPCALVLLQTFTPSSPGPLRESLANIHHRMCHIWDATQKMIFDIGVVLMWVCLAFIVVIRNEAKDVFGPSYADNKLGYGQIIACGFYLQTAVEWVILIIGQFSLL